MQKNKIWIVITKILDGKQELNLQQLETAKRQLIFSQPLTVIS